MNKLDNDEVFVTSSTPVKQCTAVNYRSAKTEPNRNPKSLPKRLDRNYHPRFQSVCNCQMNYQNNPILKTCGSVETYRCQCNTQMDDTFREKSIEANDEEGQETEQPQIRLSAAGVDVDNIKTIAENLKNAINHQV